MKNHYHIATKMIPLEIHDNGMSVVTLPNVPDGVNVIIGESMPNEFGGTIVVTFVEVEAVEDEQPEKPKLEVVTD